MGFLNPLKHLGMPALGFSKGLGFPLINGGLPLFFFLIKGEAPNLGSSRLGSSPREFILTIYPIIL